MPAPLLKGCITSMLDARISMSNRAKLMSSSHSPPVLFVVPHLLGSRIIWKKEETRFVSFMDHSVYSVSKQSWLDKKEWKLLTKKENTPVLMDELQWTSDSKSKRHAKNERLVTSMHVVPVASGLQSAHNILPLLTLFTKGDRQINAVTSDTLIFQESCARRRFEFLSSRNGSLSCTLTKMHTSVANLEGHRIVEQTTWMRRNEGNKRKKCLQCDCPAVAEWFFKLNYISGWIC